MEHISKYLEKYKTAGVLKLVCEITNKLGEHRAVIVVNGEQFIGLGFSNSEALSNAFTAYNNK